jgi:hypothetical protein
MWCGECYILKPGIEFYIWMLGDELGQNKKDPRDVVSISKGLEKKESKKGRLH